MSDHDARLGGDGVSSNERGRAVGEDESVDIVLELNELGSMRGDGKLVEGMSRLGDIDLCNDGSSGNINDTNASVLQGGEIGSDSGLIVEENVLLVLRDTNSEQRLSSRLIEGTSGVELANADGVQGVGLSVGGRGVEAVDIDITIDGRSRVGTVGTRDTVGAREDQIVGRGRGGHVVLVVSQSELLDERLGGKVVDLVDGSGGPVGGKGETDTSVRDDQVSTHDMSISGREEDTTKTRLEDGLRDLLIGDGRIRKAQSEARGAAAETSGDQSHANDHHERTAAEHIVQTSHRVAN